MIIKTGSHMCSEPDSSLELLAGMKMLAVSIIYLFLFFNVVLGVHCGIYKTSYIKYIIV
jgi:hypothetical protein